MDELFGMADSPVTDDLGVAAKQAKSAGDVDEVELSGGSKA